MGKGRRDKINKLFLSKKGEMSFFIKILLLIVFTIIALGAMYFLLKRLSEGM